jgi:uncharacterized protein YjbI with pentapeptide repeats
MTKILNRFTGIIICEEASSNIRELAVKHKANLFGANLFGADLYRADLYRADLSNAKLISANLSGANLFGADLYGANLSNANLIGANLSNANLSNANLRGANLSNAKLISANLSNANLIGANLSNANLIGANLTSANLSGANLIGADLRGAKNIENLEWTNFAKRDILFILSYSAKVEVVGLKSKIVEGKINGSQYEGECCCLIGSLGNDKAVSLIPFYTKGLHNIGEQLFYQIKEGDTPENNIFSKIALEMCDLILSKYENY